MIFYIYRIFKNIQYFLPLLVSILNSRPTPSLKTSNLAPLLLIQPIWTPYSGQFLHAPPPLTAHLLVY